MRKEREEGRKKEREEAYRGNGIRIKHRPRFLHLSPFHQLSSTLLNVLLRIKAAAELKDHTPKKNRHFRTLLAQHADSGECHGRRRAEIRPLRAATTTTATTAAAAAAATVASPSTVGEEGEEEEGTGQEICATRDG